MTSESILALDNRYFVVAASGHVLWIMMPPSSVSFLHWPKANSHLSQRNQNNIQFGFAEFADIFTVANGSFRDEKFGKNIGR